MLHMLLCLYMHVSNVLSVSDVYDANVSSEYFKSRSGIACRGRWLSLLLGAAVCQPTWVSRTGPGVGMGPATDTGASARVGCGTRSMGQDVDTGAAQVWEPCPDATSRPRASIRALCLPFIVSGSTHRR
jgi:hypothetical protein